MSNQLCPLESLNVTKSDNTLKVDAKRTNATSSEPPKYFTGPNRFHEFKRFFDFLITNTPEFANCTNPLANDPDYINAVGNTSTSSMPSNTPPSTTPISTPSTSNPSSTGSFNAQYWNSMFPPPSTSSSPTSNPVGLPSSTGSFNAQYWNSMFPPPSTSSSSSSWNEGNFDTSSDPYINQLLSTHSSKPSSSYFSSSSSSVFDNPNLKWNWWNVLIYVVKIGVIFGLVFALLTYVPKVEISLVNKIIISTVVVFIGALIDIALYILEFIKGALCTNVCNC